MFKAIRQFFSDVKGVRKGAIVFAKEIGKDAIDTAGRLVETGAEEIVRCHAKTRRGEHWWRFTVAAYGHPQRPHGIVRLHQSAPAVFADQARCSLGRHDGTFRPVVLCDPFSARPLLVILQSG